MPRIPYEQMTYGQLKLEFAARCAHHGCDGGLALGHSGRAPEEFLRASLILYRNSMATGYLGMAEEALIKVIEYKAH